MNRRERTALDDPAQRLLLLTPCSNFAVKPQNEGRPLLIRLLQEEPSDEVIEALLPVADEDAMIRLGQVGRSRPDLAQSVIDGLDAIGNGRAKEIAETVRPEWGLPAD